MVGVPGRAFEFAQFNPPRLSRRYTSPMPARIRLLAIVVLLAGGTLTTLAQIPPSRGAGREGYASVPGARLFYSDTGGAGVPVVLLHAATGNTSAWQYQTRAFTTAGYRLIAYDRRGWGRTVVDSDGPAGTGADDLRGLLDWLDLDRVHVVATAGGGFVAFDFALSFPARLRSLVVADSIGGVQDKEILDLETRIRPPQFDELPPEVRELSPGYRAANPEGTQRWVDVEKQSRPSRTMASTLQLAYATPKPVNAIAVREDSHARVVAHRWRRHDRAARADEDSGIAHPECRIHRRAQAGHSVLLGRAGAVQQRRARLHPEVLNVDVAGDSIRRQPCETGAPRLAPLSYRHPGFGALTSDHRGFCQPSRSRHWNQSTCIVRTVGNDVIDHLSWHPKVVGRIRKLLDQ
jgi:pimeloyl-ACP methyl ester carboxylesterase